MKIKIIKEDPGHYAFKEGDVLDFPEALAKELVEAGTGEPVKGSSSSVKTATRQKREKAVSKRGRKSSK